MRLCSIASFVLLLLSFHHEKDIFVPTTFGDIVSFLYLGKTASFDYKAIHDFTRQQCQLKSGDQANTQTKRLLYPRFTPSRGSGNHSYVSLSHNLIQTQNSQNM
uniref:Secreted protein n=1 Tax=Amphimedon queenslandica TaxID=400682 RepID=A0A1X7UVW3_AMPQE